MDLVEEARVAAKLAGALADEAETLRRLPSATVDALAQAGMFTMCLPAAYGGPGVSPVEMIDAVIELAYADGAAGWCAGIASTTASMAAFLAPDVARRIYHSPSVATGGVYAPNATAADEHGGLRVTGRWAWGSGTQHCEWIVGGARTADGRQVVCFFPAGDVTFHDTWHSVGLRGTGSLDFSVDGAWVPDELVVAAGSAVTPVDEPIARFPNFTLLALGIAATGLGVAKRALDELVELAAGKTPQFSSRTLANSGFAQTEAARAAARWGAARSYLRDEVAAAWDQAVAGEPISVARRVAMRMAAANAAAAGVEVADAAWTLAGGSAVYTSSVLGRCVRDAHVVTQHIMVAPKLYETLGRFVLGADFDASMI